MNFLQILQLLELGPPVQLAWHSLFQKLGLGTTVPGISPVVSNREGGLPNAKRRTSGKGSSQAQGEKSVVHQVAARRKV